MANQTSAYTDPRMQGQSSLGSNLGDGREALSQSLRKVDEMVRQHEAPAVMIALAAGFGVGVAIGCALAGNRSVQSSDRQAAENIGQRVLSSLEQILPEAISNRLNQLV